MHFVSTSSNRLLVIRSNTLPVIIVRGVIIRIRPYFILPLSKLAQGYYIEYLSISRNMEQSLRVSGMLNRWLRVRHETLPNYEDATSRQSQAAPVRGICSPS